MTPRISVLLPVRDGAAFLREALESVLAQTLRDFELIVVDDGSEDATPAILASLGDDRLRVIRQEPAAGLVAALRRALAEARGDVLARMDADDVALPERLERQLHALEADEQVAVVGCAIETIDEGGRVTGSWSLPADDAALRRRLLLRNPFTHGAVLLRRSAVEAAGGYQGGYGANEDYDLWRRIARDWRFAAVPEVLYRYRVHPAAVTKTRVEERIAARERLRDELWREPALLRALGGERELAEARALAREALRRRRLALGARLAAEALRLQLRPASSS
jgi:glycosyltransferase involved in cell wall biosynthesis